MENEVVHRQTVVDNRIGQIKATRTKYIEAFSSGAAVNVSEIEAMLDRMSQQQTVPVTFK